MLTITILLVVQQSIGTGITYHPYLITSMRQVEQEGCGADTITNVREMVQGTSNT